MAYGISAPAVIVHKERRFLIMETPTERNIEAYAKVTYLSSNRTSLVQVAKVTNIELQVLKNENVSTVVRTCEPAYSADRLKAKGIAVKVILWKYFFRLWRRCN